MDEKALESLGGEDRGQVTSVKTVAAASAIGTTIEWYDFLIYGTAAALVFNQLFFPTLTPLIGTLVAFSTIGVGFVARPLGGIVFGHYGDRIGRKTMLFLTLLIMGVSTFFVGLMPTYNSIGVWAPILLVALRLLQGFAVGGEWGGAVLMAVEYAPEGKRGLYGSMVQIGFPLGLVAATASFAALSGLPEEQFLAWGWRLPFLASIVLVAVGLFIRLRIQETPTFRRVRETGTEVRLPVVEVLRRYPKNLLVAFGVRITEVSWVYILTIFVIAYATEQLGLPRGMILNGILLGATLELLAVPFFGALSDRVGRRPIYMVGAVLAALYAFPLFWLLDTREPWLVWLAIVLGLSIGHGVMYGTQAAFLSEMFDARVRYTGASLANQLSAAIGGGLSPVIAAALLAWSGGRPWPISVYMAALAVITIVSVILAKETSKMSIDGDILQSVDQDSVSARAGTEALRGDRPAL